MATVRFISISSLDGVYLVASLGLRVLELTGPERLGRMLLPVTVKCLAQSRSLCQTFLPTYSLDGSSVGCLVACAAVGGEQFQALGVSNHPALTRTS